MKCLQLHSNSFLPEMDRMSTTSSQTTPILASNTPFTHVWVQFPHPALPAPSKFSYIRKQNRNNKHNPVQVFY